ncbi:PKD domain-containing protein [Salinisphaera hydrothermalis]|uniref:PKD domain-containing protein n=1 Tax=Salinisphaera hydrothermalis TaxID=563188 RepID=UPI0033407FD7
MSWNRIAGWVACLGLFCVLAGCGGGGGGDNGSGGSSSPGTACTVPAGFKDDAGADQNVKTGALVQLDGTASRGAGGTAPTSYQWSFTARPNGSNARLSSSTSAAPQFTADQAGQYVVKLVINGKNDCAAQTDSVTITATTAGANAVPTADAGAAQSVNIGTRVTLSGAQSHDPDGNTLTYAWQFVSRPSGSSAQLTDANTVSPSFTADKAGTYVVGLRVNDGQATSERADVAVVAAAGDAALPVADAGPDQSVDVNSVVRLDGSASRDPENRLITYAWHFVSKPAGSNASITGADTARPIFQPDVAGTYVASLTVDNGQNQSQPDTVIVTASNNARPVADAGVDQNVQAGVLVNLDGSGSRDPEGRALSYHWTFVSMPAGSQTALVGSSTTTPSFTPDVAGEYVVQLVVDDGQAESPADTAVVTAASANSAPVANAGNDRNVAVTSQVTLDGSGSSDADNNALTYQWTLISRPAGSSATLSGADTVTPSFTADTVGFYVLALQVNDGQVDSAPDLVVITASPTLALYIGSSSGYQSVGGSSDTASIQVPVGGQNVLLDQFRIEALSSDFTVTNVQSTSATTAGGQTITPRFDGLQSGDTIAAGDQLDFATRLASVPNAPGQYQVKLQFTVSPSGKTYRFTYNVNIQ